jgi:hypothetical protein
MEGLIMDDIFEIINRLLDYRVELFETIKEEFGDRISESEFPEVVQDIFYKILSNVIEEEISRSWTYNETTKEDVLLKNGLIVNETIDFMKNFMENRNEQYVEWVEESNKFRSISNLYKITEKSIGRITYRIVTNIKTKEKIKFFFTYPSQWVNVKDKDEIIKVTV